MSACFRITGSYFTRSRLRINTFISLRFYYAYNFCSTAKLRKATFYDNAQTNFISLALHKKQYLFWTGVHIVLPKPAVDNNF